jgi:vacuolar-type H+-ATPase subunit I/STV1
MSTLLIVLSGPKSSEQQARTALAASGYTVQNTDHNHGLPDHPQGKKVRQATSFVTVEADEGQLDAVAAAASSLGFHLRMHHTKPEPAPVSAEQELAHTLAEMRAEIAELREKVG